MNSGTARTLAALFLIDQERFQKYVHNKKNFSSVRNVEYLQGTKCSFFRQRMLQSIQTTYIDTVAKGIKWKPAFATDESRSRALASVGNHVGDC